MRKINTEIKTVYSAACGSYNEEKICGITADFIEKMLRENNFEPKGKNVVIKPNLLAKREPDKAITTHPYFIFAAAKYFVSRGAHVTVADSPGGTYNKGVLTAVYNVTGMKEAAEKAGAELNFDVSSVKVESGGTAVKYFEILAPLANADLIVNICRLKTHAMCEMSAAVKNMYGSVPGLQKAEMHARFPGRHDFAKMLTELCMTNAPQINITDAVCGMEGNGPAGGTVKKVGLILGSSNPYVLDSVCAKIMGYERDEVETVKISEEMGYIPKNDSEIEIIGENIEKYITKFVRPDGTAGGLMKQLPTILGGRLQKLMEPRPYITGNCIGCGECARCCPAETITVENKKAKINRSKCIKCYCCQELCPRHAVKIKRNFFLKF